MKKSSRSKRILMRVRRKNRIKRRIRMWRRRWRKITKAPSPPKQ